MKLKGKFSQKDKYSVDDFEKKGIYHILVTDQRRYEIRNYSPGKWQTNIYKHGSSSRLTYLFSKTLKEAKQSIVTSENQRARGFIF